MQPGAQEEGAGPHCEGVTVTVSQDRVSPRIKGALSQCPQRCRRERGCHTGFYFSGITSVRCNLEPMCAGVRPAGVLTVLSDLCSCWRAGLLSGRFLCLKAFAFSRTASRLLKHLFASVSGPLRDKKLLMYHEFYPLQVPGECGRVDLMTRCVSQA